MPNLLPENYESLEKCFGARLMAAMEDREWTILDLREKLGMNEYSHTRVENWVAGRNVPLAKDLRLIAMVLDVSLDWLICVKRDNFSPRVEVPKHNYENQRDKILNKASVSLWMQMRTGASLGWKRATMTNIIRSRSLKQIRLLICPPEGEANSQAEEKRNQFIREIVGNRRETRQNNAIGVSDTIKDTLYELAKVVQDINIPHLVEVRTIGYVPASVIHIIDAMDDECEDAALVALQSNYKLDFEYAPLIVAEKKKSKDVFNFYKRNFLELWNDGKQIDLARYYRE